MRDECTHTRDLPRQVAQAFSELGRREPGVYRLEAVRRLRAAMQSAEDGDTGHAILLTGIAQGFLTLYQRLEG